MIALKCERAAGPLHGAVVIADVQVVPAQAGNEIRVKRIEFHGAITFPRGLFGTVHPQKKMCEIVANLGISGIKTEGMAKTLLCFDNSIAGGVCLMRAPRRH